MFSRLGFGLSLAALAVLLLVSTRLLTPGASGAKSREAPAPARPAAAKAPAKTSVNVTRRAPAAVPESDPPPQTGQLYRWRDVNGSIRIQSTPPPAGVKAQIISFERPPPREPAPRTAAGKADSAEPAARAREVLERPLRVYTPEGFDDLLEHVEDTAAKLYERRREMESLKKQL